VQHLATAGAGNTRHQATRVMQLTWDWARLGECFGGERCHGMIQQHHFLATVGAANQPPGLPRLLHKAYGCVADKQPTVSIVV